MSTPDENTPTPNPLDTMPDAIPPELHELAMELASRNVLGKGILSPEIEGWLLACGQIWAAVTPEGLVVSCARHPALVAIEREQDPHRMLQSIRAEAAGEASPGEE